MANSNNNLPEARLDYDILGPNDHLMIAAFNGNLEEVRKALAKGGSLVVSGALALASFNNHHACVAHLREVKRAEEAQEAEYRRLHPPNPKIAYIPPSIPGNKICASCGPVDTKWSNCPRCWGPVNARKR